MAFFVRFVELFYKVHEPQKFQRNCCACCGNLKLGFARLCITQTLFVTFVFSALCFLVDLHWRAKVIKYLLTLTRLPCAALSVNPHWHKTFRSRPMGVNAPPPLHPAPVSSCEVQRSLSLGTQKPEGLEITII
jgi:hypothetical protein